MATRFQEARVRGFDFSRDLRVPHLLGRTLFEQARAARGEAQRQHREALLLRTLAALEAALAIDPEAAAVHHTLSQVQELLGDTERAAYHRAAHERHRTDDLAVATAVARHRAATPPANHAAEAITLYDLQREVGVVTGAGSSRRRGLHPEHGIEGGEADAAIASCTEQDSERQEAGRP